MPAKVFISCGQASPAERQFIRIITNHYQFELDLRKVDKEEIEQAKTILQRMNFDNHFKMRLTIG